MIIGVSLCMENINEDAVGAGAVETGVLVDRWHFQLWRSAFDGLGVRGWQARCR